MPTYLYCVLPAAAEAPDVMPIGVGGTPARHLAADPLAAWVETVSDRRVTPTRERVKAHDVVTEAALLTDATPLPARFGQTFQSDAECVGALRARESRLLADLAQVQGMVEMRVVVRLVSNDGEAPAGEAPSPGRAYMDRLMRTRGREHRLETDAAAVRAEIAALVGQLARREAFTLNASTGTLMLAHLVAREDVRAYRSAVEGATLVSPVGRLVVSGPGAPYQFVSPPV